MMAKYKTEKRKANVGERILITNAGWTFGDYDNGDVLTVVDSFGKNAVLVDGEDFPQITHEEYEVIVAENPTKPSKNERISLLESQVAELQARVEALQKPKYVFGVDLAKPTPNEQRKAVIERAKAFITEYSPIAKSGQSPLTKECGPIRIEFVVNAGKRTVVAIPHLANVGGIVTYAKAIAKCAPDDVFNADIGKAIALGRALGLDVSEFENAVKPAEVVVGHKIRRHFFNDTETYERTVKSFEPTQVRYTTGSFDMLDSVRKDSVITDDTEAQY